MASALAAAATGVEPRQTPMAAAGSAASGSSVGLWEKARARG